MSVEAPNLPPRAGFDNLDTGPTAEQEMSNQNGRGLLNHKKKQILVGKTLSTWKKSGEVGQYLTEERDIDCDDDVNFSQNSKALDLRGRTLTNEKTRNNWKMASNQEGSHLGNKLEKIAPGYRTARNWTESSRIRGLELSKPLESTHFGTTTSTPSIGVNGTSKLKIATSLFKAKEEARMRGTISHFDGLSQNSMSGVVRTKAIFRDRVEVDGKVASFSSFQEEKSHNTMHKTNALPLAEIKLDGSRSDNEHSTMKIISKKTIAKAIRHPSTFRGNTNGPAEEQNAANNQCLPRLELHSKAQSDWKLKGETHTSHPHPARDVSFIMDQGTTSQHHHEDSKYYRTVFEHIQFENEQYQKTKAEEMEKEKEISLYSLACGASRKRNPVLEVKKDAKLAPETVLKMLGDMEKRKLPPPVFQIGTVDMAVKSKGILGHSTQKQSFMDLLLAHPSLVPNNDTLIQDLTAQVPGALSNVPASRLTATQLKSWLQSWLDPVRGNPEVIQRQTVEIALVECARQAHLLCSDRGELMLFCLENIFKSHKRILQEQEQQAVLDHAVALTHGEKAREDLMKKLNQADIKYSEKCTEMNSVLREAEILKRSHEDFSILEAQ